MPFDIETALFAKHDTMKDGVFLHAKTVGGEKFIDMKKSCWQITKLLTEGLACDTRYPLARTDVIEQLTQLRNEQFNINVYGGEDKPMTPRYTSKKMKPVIIRAPETVDITTPQIGEVQPVVMRVILAKPGKGLYIQATDENLEYIRSAVAHQVMGEQVQSKRQRTNVPDEERVEVPDHVGVSYSYKREAFRVTTETHEGKVKNAYIKTEKIGMAAAMETAINRKMTITDYFKKGASSHADIGAPSDAGSEGDARRSVSDNDSADVDVES